MGVYNLNPRRVVWFSPNEPSNKYDIWLSRNAHLDENGEPTTDSNSQRDCDYIFKIYDCGKWNPIVGFNSTAANKIDTVTGADYTIDGVTHSGKEVYHPAIFTDESPNELYDAGTLGSLLSNLNFVSLGEWYDVFNSTDYNWSGIFGGTNWFGDLIWETIQGGSSTYQLPWATTERCGGILSATHPAASSAFKPIEVKFYPTVLGYYQNEQHRLCVSASDVIQLINSYYNDNPSGSSININWNSTTIHQLAEVLLDVFKNSSSLGFEDVWSLASDPHVYPHIWGVNSTNAGKFLRINPTWSSEGTGWSLSNNNMDWVDLVLNHLTDVNIQNPANNQILIYNSTTGKWENSNSLLQSIDFATDRQCGGIYADQFNYSPNYWAEAKFAPTGSSAWGPYEHRLIVDLEDVTYKDGNLISINQNNQINIDASNSQNGNVIISDSGVAKWGAVPNPTLGSTLISSGGFVTINGLRISTTTSFTINGQSYLDTDYDLNTWNYYTLENAKSITITNTQTNPEPLYIRVISAPDTLAFSCAGDIIDAQSVLSNTYEKDILITMQFGIAKFEEINTQSSTPVIDNLN